MEGAAKHIPELSKAASSYVDTLDRAAKAEIDDKAEKTLYARALKLLRDQLNLLDRQFDAKIDQQRVALDDSLNANQKAAAQAHKSLASTLANAAVAIKSIKAKPTLAEFNKHFGASVSDTPTRKVQVQLLAVAKGKKAGELSFESTTDPQSVAADLTPWQSGGKNQCELPSTADQDVVLKRLAELTRLIKLADQVLDGLDAAEG